MSTVLKLPTAQIPGELPAAVYRQAVDQADIGISITDMAANILYCNAAFSKTSGYEPEEALGQNQSLLSYKKTPPALYADMWEKLRQGLSWHGHLLNRRKDGSPYLAELNVTPVHESDGTVRHFLGMHRDVTAMHQLEQRLLNQKLLIEAAFDAAPMAIALLDDQGKVVLDNHAYKKLVADLGVAEPADLLLAALAKGALPSRDGGVDVRIERGGGRKPRWFCCNTQMIEIRDESADSFFSQPRQPSLLLIASDVTALHEEQEKVRNAALQAMLADEEHSATLRESLSAALYQIEEPINVIASAVALMRGRGDTAASGVSAVLENAVNGARARIDELRKLLPRETRDDECAVAINLNEVVRDVLDLLTPRLLASGITIDWHPEPVLPALLGSPLHLRSAVKILIDNAIDAIVDQRGQNRSARREIALATLGRRESATLLVDDSGPGIPQELRLKVFEPFFSAGGQSSHHLGTGLSRAQQIIADHGGILDILDAPQGGCRMRVELPTGRER